MKRINSYKKFIQKAKGAIRSSRIPKSFSKKNNNVFSNEKHIIIQVLRQYEKLDYRKTIKFIELLKYEIGLEKIPHFTTINKFALRAKPFWFEQLIAQIIFFNFFWHFIFCDNVYNNLPRFLFQFLLFSLQFLTKLELSAFFC